MREYLSWLFCEAAFRIWDLGIPEDNPLWVYETPPLSYRVLYQIGLPFYKFGILLGGV